MCGRRACPFSDKAIKEIRDLIAWKKEHDDSERRQCELEVMLSNIDTHGDGF